MFHHYLGLIYRHSFRTDNVTQKQDALVELTLLPLYVELVVQKLFQNLVYVVDMGLVCRGIHENVIDVCNHKLS